MSFVPPKDAKPGTLWCRACGREMNDDESKFCRGCGHSTEGAWRMQPQDISGSSAGSPPGSLQGRPGGHSTQELNMKQQPPPQRPASQLMNTTPRGSPFPNAAQPPPLPDRGPMGGPSSPVAPGEETAAIKAKFANLRAAVGDGAPGAAANAPAAAAAQQQQQQQQQGGQGGFDPKTGLALGASQAAGGALDATGSPGGGGGGGGAGGGGGGGAAGTADVQSLVEGVKVKKRNRRGRAQTRTLYLDGTTVWVGKSRAKATKFFPLLHLDVADSRGSSEVAGGWLLLRRTTGEALDLHVTVLPDARFPSSATLHALLDAQRSLYAREMEERSRKELEETRLRLLHEGGGGEAPGAQGAADGEWDQQEQEFDHLLSMSLMSGGGGLQARLEQKDERLNWRWSTFSFRIQGTELTRKGNDGNVNARYTITGACRHCRPVPPLPSLPPLPRLIAATAAVASDTSPRRLPRLWRAQAWRRWGSGRAGAPTAGTSTWSGRTERTTRRPRWRSTRWSRAPSATCGLARRSAP